MQHGEDPATASREDDEIHGAPADDGFVSHEELLQREEEARYGGTQASDRFTVMYYPQSRLLNVLTVLQRKCVVLEPKRSTCTACSKPLCHVVHRFFVDESLYCTACLKTMGCCVLPSSSNTLCADVVGIVLSFLPEYYQATLAARVCKMWMGCFNFNNNHESDMMATKRYWISRELHFQRAALKRDQTQILLFEQRFDLAPLLGQWADGGFRTPRQWLTLCRRIVESGYYAQAFDIAVSTNSAVPSVRFVLGEQAVMECTVPGTSPNLFRIPLCLSEKGGTLSNVQHAAEQGAASHNTFSATVSTNGERLDLQLDPLTGVVSLDENSRPRRKKLRCVCL